jgi:hypothetical protein
LPWPLAGATSERRQKREEREREKERERKREREIERERERKRENKRRKTLTAEHTRHHDGHQIQPARSNNNHHHISLQPTQTHILHPTQKPSQIKRPAICLCAYRSANQRDAIQNT